MQEIVQYAGKSIMCQKEHNMQERTKHAENSIICRK
jgi:hypothetical protein